MITFKVKDIMNEDELVSQYVAGLSLINNDLSYIRGMIKEEFGIVGDEINLSSDFSKGKINYLIRLSSSHMKEAIKFIHEATTKVEEIKQFNNNLSEVTIEDYRYIMAGCTPWDGSFVKQYIDPIRNSFFHYPKPNDKKEELKLVIRKVKNNIANVDPEKNINDLRFDFADDISSELFLGNLGGSDSLNKEYDFNKIMPELLQYLYYLIRYCQGVVFEYIIERT